VDAVGGREVGRAAEQRGVPLAGAVELARAQRERDAADVERYRASSARAFSPRANCSNDGPRSGIERQINGSSGPVYSSRM
jgi:hypothetical protein